MGGIELIAAAALAVAGWAAALLLYAHLRRWTAHLRAARIAVAYKKRVEMQAPLIDWLTWALALAEDEQSNGRVVYRHGYTSVAILKPGDPVAKVEAQT